MKALIIDAHPCVRFSVAVLLDQVGFEVVLEVKNGVDAMKLIPELAPDLVVLDIDLPRLGGPKLIASIKALIPSCICLVLTSQPATYFSKRCLVSGAAGYISKTSSLKVLNKAVRAIINGYCFFPDMANNVRSGGDCDTAESKLIQSLSNRELTILQYLSLGRSNKNIAEVMQLSSKTVSTYKMRLIKKLGMDSVVMLADLARRNNLV